MPTYTSDTIFLNGAIATGAGTGSWISVADYIVPLSIDIRATGSVSVEVRVSNELNKPDDSTDGLLLQTASTANALVSLTTPVKWLKLKPATVGGGAAVAAYLHAIRFRVRFQGSSS